MKKNRIITILALVGAALVLAACTVVVKQTLSSSRVDFKSTWQVDGSNEWARCENTDTTFEYSFKISDPQSVDRVEEFYTGVATERTIRETARPGDSNYRVESDGTVVVERTIAANDSVFPASVDEHLTGQAIVVKPIQNDPTRNNGETNFRFEVSANGGNNVYVSPGEWNILSFTSCEE